LRIDTDSGFYSVFLLLWDTDTESVDIDTGLDSVDTDTDTDSDLAVAEPLLGRFSCSDP
jgi:hypothetical protein